MKAQEVFLWLIGGSAGSFTPVRNALHQLPYYPDVAIVLCLHRMRNARIGMAEAIGPLRGWQICEPDDKTPIQGGYVYVAPADYHLLVEAKGYF